MLKKPCIRCGKPGKALCDDCNKKQTRTKPTNQVYRDPAYARNRKIMIERAWELRVPCVKCGKPFKYKGNITAEHIIPVRRGGTNELSNLAPAHWPCNAAWRDARDRSES